MAEQLSSFKVGDKLKKDRQSAPQKEEKPAAPEKPSAGFPRVEALIDEYTTAEQAKEVFGESLAQLEGLLAVEKQPKKKADIAKAKRAFEHAMSTFDYLFQVRAELAQAATVTGPMPVKPGKR